MGRFVNERHSAVNSNAMMDNTEVGATTAIQDVAANNRSDEYLTGYGDAETECSVVDAFDFLSATATGPPWHFEPSHDFTALYHRTPRRCCTVQAVECRAGSCSIRVIRAIRGSERESLQQPADEASRVRLKISRSRRVR